MSTPLDHHLSLLCSACDSPRSPLGRLAPISAGATFCGVQQPLVPAPAGFVPMTSCGMPAEPQSPLAAGLHWADGFAAQEAQPSAAFPGTGSAAPAPDEPPLGAPCCPPNPMDLEQVGWAACAQGGGLWQAGPGEEGQQLKLAAAARCLAAWVEFPRPWNASL